MTFSQFLYGWFNGEGIRLTQQGNVDKMLCEQSLSQLFLLGKNESQDGLYINKFEREQVVAYSHLTTDYDDSGRRVRRNHTMLVSYDDVFRVYSERLLSHFVDDCDKFPAPLKPLEVTA
jgi:hypothetical protein